MQKTFQFHLLGHGPPFCYLLAPHPFGNCVEVVVQLGLFLFRRPHYYGHNTGVWYVLHIRLDSAFVKLRFCNQLEKEHF